MAVVLHFPDRFAVASTGPAKAGWARRAEAPACEIVILPCIRREPLERATPSALAMPAQLQA